jgi:Zn-dependent protease
MKALILLLFSSTKFGKLLTTGGTMLLSLAVYSWIWGWRYAAGFLVLLLIHEMGHYVAARQRGLKVGAPTFIPFVGAWITMKEQPHDVETEAYVALAGPMWGTVASIATYFLGRAWGSDLLLAICYSGLFLNLFNLLPISPLDGGRITAAISPRVWLLGAPLLLALLFYRPSPALLLVAALAIPQLTAAWRYDSSAPENAAYYGVSAQIKLEYAAAYLTLTIVLAIMTYDVHDMLSLARATRF